MTLKSYLRMLLAAVTLMFVTTGCNDDEEKVGPPPSYTFGIAVSDVTETEATVTVTPSNDQATYYYGAVKKADFDAFESDAAYAQNILATLKAAADRKVLSLEEYLQTALSKGSSPKKIADLIPETEYYAVAIGILTDGRFTSDLVKEAFKTGDAPLPPVVISKAGGYFFGTAFGKFDNFSLWMSEDGVTENMTVFSGEGTYLIFDLNVTVTGKATLPAGTFPVASGSDAEENTIVPGADYAGGMMTGSAIVQIKEDGTKDYFYIDGGALTIESSGSSYTLTAKVTSKGNEYEFKYRGEVSIFDTTGGGGGFELSIDVTNITATTAKVSVTSSDETSPYYFDLLDEEDYQLYGGTPEGITEFISELWAFYQTQYPTLTLPQILSQIVSIGNDSYDFDGLTPAAKYYTFAIGVDATTGAATTTAVVKEFTTQAGGGGDGPELTLTMKAGDPDGANLSTAVTCIIKSSGATAAKAGLWPKSIVDEVLAEGETIESIINNEQIGQSLEGNNLAAINGAGLPFYTDQATPETEYITIAKVTDASGNTTIKSATAFTESAGEASDAYKAWLGTWTVTSTSSQVNSSPVSFDVVFSQKIANLSYAISGWGIDALRDDAELMPTVTFDSATGGITIQNDQHLANNGGQSPGKINFASNVAYQGAYAWVSGTGFNGLSGIINADKQTATVTCGVANISGVGELPVNGMEVILWGSDGKTYVFGPATGYTKGDYPIGPYTMTKKSSATSAKNAVRSSVIPEVNLSSVLSVKTVVSAPAKQISVKAQASELNTLSFVKPAAVYEATIGNVANIEKPLGLKKHFIKK